MTVLTSSCLAVVLLYAGPDQILPLVSVIGGLLGVLLIWWQRFKGLVIRLFSSLRKSRDGVESISTITATTNAVKRPAEK